MITKKAAIALVDDHILLRNGLANLVREFGDYDVLFEANNGRHCVEHLQRNILPDIILLDINMPEMDGYETATWINAHYPGIRVLALSMDDKDKAIIRMLRCGVRGYILKDIEPLELRAALSSVLTNGYYYSELVSSKLVYNLNHTDSPDADGGDPAVLGEKEVQFLRLACTEMTYKEIADTMFLSPRTIDGYRDALFNKLGVKSRVGLVIYAIKNEIARL